MARSSGSVMWTGISAGNERAMGQVPVPLTRRFETSNGWMKSDRNRIPFPGSEWRGGAEGTHREVEHGIASAGTEDRDVVPVPGSIKGKVRSRWSVFVWWRENGRYRYDVVHRHFLSRRTHPSGC